MVSEVVIEEPVAGLRGVISKERGDVGHLFLGAAPLFFARRKPKTMQLHRDCAVRLARQRGPDLGPALSAEPCGL